MPVLRSCGILSLADQMCGGTCSCINVDFLNVVTTQAEQFRSSVTSIYTPASATRCSLYSGIRSYATHTYRGVGMKSVTACTSLSQVGHPVPSLGTQNCVSHGLCMWFHTHTQACIQHPHLRGCRKYVLCTYTPLYSSRCARSLHRSCSDMFQSAATRSALIARSNNSD